MIKQLFVTAALACCSAIAQAGIVKDYFSELCARTEVEPVEMTAAQMPGKAVDAGVDIMKTVTMTDETNAKAMALVESWDRSKLAADVSEGKAVVKVFCETVDGTGKAECLVVVKEGDSPLVFIYVEGNAKILESLNAPM